MSQKLRVLDILSGTSVDGPGLRTAVYLAGCAHKCPGCHNPQSHDFSGGHEMTAEGLFHEIMANDEEVTFSGGDPIYQAKALIPLLKMLKEAKRDIWLYTGFIFEDISSGKAGKDAIRLLDYIDTLVDGPFIESLRDLNLLFRGSSNQRIIDVSHTLVGDNIAERREFYDSFEI